MMKGIFLDPTTVRHIAGEPTSRNNGTLISPVSHTHAHSIGFTSEQGQIVAFDSLFLQQRLVS